MKKIVVILAIIVIVIVGLNLLFTSLRLNNNTYSPLKNNSEANDYLFKKEKRNQIFLNYALGNDSEQIYFYKYKKKYDLVVWNIKGFLKVDLSNIHLYKVENIDNININPQRFFNLGYFKLMSKQKKMKSFNLSMFTNLNAKVIYHKEKANMAYLDIITNGLILGNNSTSFIKVVSVKELDFNFIFLKDTKGFHFLIFSSKTNVNRNENKLLDIISIPIKEGADN